MFLIFSGLRLSLISCSVGSRVSSVELADNFVRLLQMALSEATSSLSNDFRFLGAKCVVKSHCQNLE